jgi:hypothetical protein
MSVIGSLASSRVKIGFLVEDSAAEP